MINVPGTGYKYNEAVLRNLTDAELIHFCLGSSDALIKELAERLSNYVEEPADVR